MNYFIKEALENSTNITETINKLASHFNCSARTIWRKANKLGYTSRNSRSDKGKTKVDDEILNIAGSLIAKSKRKNDKYTFDVKEVYRHLTEDLGYSIDVGYTRFCTLLQEKGLTVEEFKKAAPHIQVISEHPNQLHQFDISICLQWYFDAKKGTIEEDVEYKRKYYSNKLEQTVVNELQGKKKLHRYVLVDHCSGAFFFWYYYSEGENALDGSDFLFKAWSPKKELISNTLNVDYNGIYQFQGLPKILYTDRGAVLKKKALRNLLNDLNVKVEFHESGNPRAKGMVEGLMNIIEKGFESYLKIYGIKDIDSLNAFALKWCIDRNIRNEFRKQKISRIHLWRKIKQEQFIKCPDYKVWVSLIQDEPLTRKVDGNGNISYKNKQYTITDTNIFNQYVTIKPNPFIQDTINIHYNGLVFTLEPNTIDEYGRVISTNSVTVGNIKSLKETSTEKFNKLAETTLSNIYGVDFKGKGNKRMMTPPDKQKEDTILETDNIAHLEPRSTDIPVNSTKPITNEKREVKKEAGTNYIKISEIVRMYNAEYGRITPDQRAKIVELYPKGIPFNITVQDIYNLLHSDIIDISNKLA